MLICVICSENSNIFCNFATLKRNNRITNAMRRLIVMAMMFLPMMAAAQNSWEMENQKGVAENPDKKYLAGAVPVVNGMVEFSTVIDAPGKSAAQIYDILKDYMTKLTKEENQFEQSRMVMLDSINHKLGGSYQEWLVFKSKPLVLDRTRLMYTLIAECADGKATVKMRRIYYLYEEERDPQVYKAEEWITDEYGLKRSKQKLSRVTGKFRRKTIDRKDYLFNKMAGLLK